MTRVAGDARGETLVVGLDDGRVWSCRLPSEPPVFLRAEKGPPISALAMVAGRRVAWGDEEGGAGILALDGV